jgi:cobalt-zinc-cadmium efflux system protein
MHHHGENGHAHDLPEIKGISLFFTIVLNLLITVAETIGGMVSGSLSLISDALHNLSDGLALIISFFALKIAEKANDRKRTFGYKRASIMAAFVNSAVLIGIALFLFEEAYRKFIHYESVNGAVVIWVALIGLVANLLGVWLLRQGSQKNLNIKTAYFHLLSDALSSVAVILGGLAIYYFRVYWVDPLLTVLISLYVLKESLDILKETVRILMQGAPSHLNLDEIVTVIKENPGVEAVNHVHLWNMDEQNVHFEARLEIADMRVSEAEKLGRAIETQLKEQFGINHTTLQYECAGDCPRGMIDADCCKTK